MSAEYLHRMRPAASLIHVTVVSLCRKTGVTCIFINVPESQDPSSSFKNDVINKVD
jgi:hypothetical protein